MHVRGGGVLRHFDGKPRNLGASSASNPVQANGTLSERETLMRSKILSILFFALALVACAGASETEVADGGKPIGVHPPPVAKRPQVQLAILLDTSGSMDGLIDQAKSQLWKIVNEFIAAKRHGQRPEVHVALYEYGKQTLPAGENFLRCIVPFTQDLDKVSEELFALKTNGGEEYCGAVIQHAAEHLQWSAAADDLKAIFIAGNEAFGQGRVDYRSACRGAIAKGILVNTIFCGNVNEGVRTNWKDGADLADGRYMHIDQNRTVAAVQAPQDAELADLNQKLNGTYVAFGRKAEAAKERQIAQDANAAAAAPEAAAQRAATKASGLYNNAEWDLVDALREKKVALEEVAEGELPAEMKQLDKAGREAYVEGKSKERAELQAKILALTEARNKHVAEEMKKRAAGGEETLDAAMIKSIREQGQKKGFAFGE